MRLTARDGAVPALLPLVPIAAVWLCASSGAEAATYKGSGSEKLARAEGRKLVRELAVDLDGDGRTEVALVEQLADGKMRALVARERPVEEDEEVLFEIVATGSAKPAKNVLRFDAKQLAGDPRPELLLVLEEPSPDETAEHVRILAATGQGIREIFAQTFFLQPEARPDPNVYAFGDATPHFAVTDVDEKDGSDQEIVWVDGPQRITLKGDKGPVVFVIGAYRKVFRYDPAKEEYTLAAEREVVDYLVTKPISEATASAQVAKVWGTAQAFWGADGDLDTAWTLEAPKGAVGQSLTLKLREPTELSMIRVVPGCGDDADRWAARYRLGKFRVTLSSGLRFEIDRSRLDAAVPGVRAVGEFPLDGGYGAQVLVFLSEKQAARWVKLEILELEPKKPAPKAKLEREACVAEVSFH